MRVLRDLSGPTPDSVVTEHVALPATRPADRALVRLGMISSVDGGSAIAGVSGGLGNVDDHAVFQALRANADVVLVGLGTALAEHYHPPADDGPEIYVIADVPDVSRNAALFASDRTTLVLPSDAPAPPDGVRELRAGSGRFVDLDVVLSGLAGRVAVLEGGPSLAGLAVSRGLVDEYFVTLSPRVIAGDSARVVHGPDADGAPWTLDHGFVDDDGYLFLRYARGMIERTRRWVPGIGVARTYQRRWLRFDLVAGVVLAAILVPQGMAYAELAGLPAVTGLYTTMACLVGYAIMGPSRVLVLGPDSSVSPLIFAAIMPLLVANGDPTTAITLAGMMAVLVGVIEIGLGLGKLGFVADLLSKEVQVGYMNGLAITIVVSQLPKLCGFSTDADGFVDEVEQFVRHFDERNATALVLGLATLAVLLVLPRLTRVVPAVLVAVVGATLTTTVFGLDIATVGALPGGLPRPQVPWTSLSDVGPLLIAAIGITLVSLTDTIATSTSFATRRGEEVDTNQEMIGLGSANITAAFFQGFAVSTSGSRTAVAEQSGAKSQLTGLVGAGIVAILLVAFPTLLADLPQTALAAVVIAAAVSLADLAALRRYRRVRQSALLLSLVGTAGVVFFGVLEGILIAVAVSIGLFFRRSWWPHGEVLGRVGDQDGWHSVATSPDHDEIPGVVVFRWEAPLFFANAGMFHDQVRRLVVERRPGWVVLQCEAITDIDVTAAEMLDRLDNELNAQGVHLAFVELRARLQDLVSRYGLLETIDEAHFYETIDEALRDIDRSDDD